MRDNDSYAWTGAVAASRGHATNGLNQYTAVGPDTFAYDANGNLTANSSPAYNHSYTYDIENRLVSANVGGQTVTLRYDPLGRLYEVAGSTSGTTRFLYDGDELVAEYSTAGTVLRRYVHGIGVDDPVVWYEGSGVGSTALRHLLTDRQGSIVGVTNSSGAILAKNSYDEYGIPKSSDPNQLVVGRFAYTGQIWLPELGMYHYKARLYSPTLGRFLQTDPIGYEDQVNLYAYVGNDPIGQSDPTGEDGQGVSLDVEIWAGLKEILGVKVSVAGSTSGGISGGADFGIVITGEAGTGAGASGAAQLTGFDGTIADQTGPSDTLSVTAQGGTASISSSGRSNSGNMGGVDRAVRSLPVVGGQFAKTKTDASSISVGVAGGAGARYSQSRGVAISTSGVHANGRTVVDFAKIASELKEKAKEVKSQLNKLVN